MHIHDENEIKTVVKSSLTRHNYYRKIHSVALLTKSEKLNDYSQNWANHLAKKDKMYHNPKNKDYGENIYYIYSTEVITDVGKDAVDAWYSEKEYFDFGWNEDDMSKAKKAYHLTQLIWKESIDLGTGMAKSSSGKIFVVSNYFPPGNEIGSFRSNIYPPSINKACNLIAIKHSLEVISITILILFKSATIFGLE
ncbi:Golgi-associated plant pathogenesis-related protein 1-like [Daktulosphaira vitifoliae]|uniref:Golgi-associated plant pathogenesis-related protein 1-like n=1 Tax=Daktulosphaira vitifoliae TaxID=58002 RepID=UPI0021A99361|nr:Golgi-associated plant pathogenesis-related protein 1-like [Daktulosphaira vitifoliae]